MKRIRDFRAPVDEATATELRRQLGALESNVVDETQDIRNSYQRVRKVTKRAARPADTLVVAPGEAVGFDTSTGDCNVTLARPEAKYAGQSVIIYKRSPLNFVNAQAANSTITGAAVFPFGNAGRYEIFCDGVEYWA